MLDIAIILVLGLAGLFAIVTALRLLPVALIGTAVFSWIAIFGFGVDGWTWLIAIGSTVASLILIFGGHERHQDAL